MARFLRALYLEHDVVDQSYVLQHKNMERALVASADRARQVANQALTDHSTTPSAAEVSQIWNPQADASTLIDRKFSFDMAFVLGFEKETG